MIFMTLALVFLIWMNVSFCTWNVRFSVSSSVENGPFMSHVGVSGGKLSNRNSENWEWMIEEL